MINAWSRFCFFGFCPLNSTFHPERYFLPKIYTSSTMYSWCISHQQIFVFWMLQNLLGERYFGQLQRWENDAIGFYSNKVFWRVPILDVLWINFGINLNSRKNNSDRQNQTSNIIIIFVYIEFIYYIFELVHCNTVGFP